MPHFGRVLCLSPLLIVSVVCNCGSTGGSTAVVGLAGQLKVNQLLLVLWESMAPFGQLLVGQSNGRC